MYGGNGDNMTYEIRKPGTTAWMKDIRDLRTAKRELQKAHRYTDYGNELRIYRVLRNGERVEMVMEG